MEERISLSEALQMMAGYGPAVWCGVATAVIVFIVEIVLCTKGILFAGWDKKLARAKKEGHMLTATRTNLRYRDREPENSTTNRMYIASYEYTVNGEVRTKQVVSTSVKPPSTITLYYNGSPNKVFSEYETGKNPLKILLFIIPVLAAYVVMTAMGFQA